MKSILSNNVVWQEGEYFVAQCLNVDVSSFGNSKNEALKNLKEALELYFEDNAAAFTTIVKPEIVNAEIAYA
jgi:predicted RNase H-like HicB family nuclease